MLTAPGERYELRTEDVAGVPCRVFVHAAVVAAGDVRGRGQ